MYLHRPGGYSSPSPLFPSGERVFLSLKEVRMSAAFDLDDVPAGEFETIARKFIARQFDAEFFAALFVVSAWLIKKGSSLVHPEMGSTEGMTAASGAAAQILESAGEPVEMNGLLQGILLKKAIEIVWREVQQFDWATLISISNLLAATPNDR